MKSLQIFRLRNFASLVMLPAMFFCLSNSVLAKPAGQSYAAIYKEVLAAAIKADEQLLTDMDTVAQTLQEFAEAQGHFPDTGDDIAGLSLELSAVLPRNPYGPNTPNAEAQKLQPSSDLLDEYSQVVKPRAQVIYDPSINETIVDRLSLQPYETWKAKPGTVVAVTNGYDLCLICGAGIDERPVKDANGRVRLTILKSNLN